MKHILLIATGGTIACKDAGDGLTPQLTSADLISLVPELETICRADTVQLMNLDSTNISSAHWLEMAACVQSHYDHYDGFVRMNVACPREQLLAGLHCIKRAMKGENS